MRALALASVLLAGCGERAPAPAAPAPPAPAAPVAAAPTCAEIVAAIREVALASSGATSDDDRAYVERYIAPIVEKTRKDCETVPWSPAHRRCIHAASGESAMLACERDAAIERGEDLGGPACERVADHLMKVSIEPTGTTAEHQAELRQRFETYCLPWTRYQKECVISATTQDAIAKCGRR